ncbi:MAG: carbohydrate kinase family protein [Anaerolineae bacterium]
MGVVVTGSLAFDYLMAFPGRFREHFLPERLDVLSVSFLVDSMRVQRGGCAANIAYNLALLGERPTIMATAGRDFGEYRRWLEEQGIDTSGIVEIEDEFTASFFVSTDLENNQIASFYIGAMGRAHELSFRNLNHRDIDLVIISPNDPQAMVNYAAECKELGIPYIYDPSQQIIRLSGEQLIEGTRGAHMLIVNEYEFEMLKKKTGLGEKALRELAQIVIVTKGERGSTIMIKDEEIDIPPAPPHQVVNPTGVGDAYRAGIIKGFLHSLPWDIVGRMASLSATYVIESDGPQCRRYSLEEFVSRYEQHFGPCVELEGVLLKR